ncbi:MAG TPA: response regulator [Bryobacteraceae bacterium]|nr:response regulator [Bryobacteraceae bacterium]
MSARSLLLVDDDPAVHELLTAVLHPPDWEIESAYDGLEGLARVEKRPYDLVLTDVRMPGMDGLEMLRRIRQIRPEAKVMVMTAESTPTSIVRAIREQAFCYFSKPFSPISVADMIAQAVDTRHWQDDIEVLSAAPSWIGLRLRCKMETADRLIQFVREMEMDIPLHERENIAAAFRELLMNAIEHGGKSDPDKRVQVTYVRTTRAIVYLIQDPGKGFSFDAIEHAAISNPPDAPARHLEIRAEKGVRPGGFGILLTRNLVDELIYNDKGNEVLFIKYLK